MSNIRIYNSETKQWETVASSEATGISTSSPEFLNEGELHTSVNEAMLRMNEKISKLERNVSWLALHGGGGSGGGSGFTSSIKITNGDIVSENGINTLYLNGKSLTLNYIITSTKANSRFLIDVTLDGNAIIKQEEGWSSVPGKLEIPDVGKFSNSSTHSIIVTATDTEGESTEPYLLTVVESNIELSSSVTGVSATIGLDYIISYKVINKVSGSDTSLIVTNITNGISKTYDLGKFTSTDPVLYDVNFFSLFSDTPSSGSSYTIEAKAQTSVNGKLIESNTVTNKVVVEDGTSLVVLIDGITTKKEVDDGAESTKFTHGGNISFSFTPYLSGVSIIYYSLKLSIKGEDIYVGKFNPSGEEGDRYSDNQFTQKGKLQVFSYSIPVDTKYIGDWDITLRCWSEKGWPVLDTELKCEVVSSSASLIEDQNPSNSRYAKWNIKDPSFPNNPTQSLWTSTEGEFIVPGTTEPIKVTTSLNVTSTNGINSGFLIDNNQSVLRLSSKSYGEIDLAPFSEEVSSNNNWSKLGFSFSITFKADYHPYEDGVIFLIGDYDTEGLFNEGIIVTLENVIWSYTDGLIKNTISTRIQQNTLNTLDFIVDKNKKEIKIFVNGILNAAREIKTDFTWKSNSKFYLAHSYYKGNREKFCDVNFYDIKLFRSALSDKQVVINYLNSYALSNLLSDGTVNYTDYNSKKLRNFFSTSDNSSTTSLWDDFTNTYANITFDQLISDSNRKSPLPVVYIDCNGSGFTKNVYEAIGANPTEYKGCTLNYFDPNSGKNNSISTGEVSVMIQGTSSTGYRSKNLEIIFRKVLYDESGGEIGPELFQPKDTWMPENQFTLKADVVDSAHSNNASIGKWINDNSDLLFDKTPPMQELESHRPVDTKEPSKKHEKVTIKHTLEGFPVILLIKFDQTDIQEFIGIYSFNLGRGSYYNMGFKFFKSFTTKIKGSDGTYIDNGCPAFVTDYKIYEPGENFGSIVQSQIYSYEFGENANLIEEGDQKLPLALFWQDDISIIKKVGEFKYNGQTGDDSSVTDNNIWERLQLLFSDLAKMTSVQVDKYRWDDSSKKYIKTGGVYNAETSWSTLADDLNNRLSLRNAYSYFMICVAFGLVDSLGKNMTLRSWNVGGDKLDARMNKWYPCFYDMDTANGLSNTGEENVPKTAYIDTYYNATAEQGGALQTIQNDSQGGYGTYSSRLWNVLRDSIFINTGVYTDGGYNELWDRWRNVGTLIKDYEYFISDYFSSQLKNCGELMYNYDYKVKYLTRYSKDIGESATYANIEFLHGNRINYVRDWLKKRFVFMDGVFNYSNEGYILPYNNKGAFKCGGSDSSSPRLYIKTNTPLIFTLNIGQIAGADKRYMIEENTSTEIILNPISSFNTQITINGMDVITEISGLKEMKFQGFMSSMKLPSLSSINISGTDTLSSSPVLFESVFINSDNFSEIRDVDLSNTSFWSGNSGVSSFIVDLEKYSKLNSLDISRSCVTSLSLPSSPLTKLKVSYSSIEILTIQSQPFIDSIDLTGCTKLKKIVIRDCPKITELTIKGYEEITDIEISTCTNLKKVVIESNPKLVSFKLINSSKVEYISLRYCGNASLQADISGASSALREVYLDSINMEILPISIYSLGITKLSIQNSRVSGIQVGANPVPRYTDGNPILDLTPFESLNSSGLKLSGNTGISYIKLDNNSEKPYEISSGSFFRGCSNLKRVFGNIKFTGTNVSSSFASCTKFYIHDYPEEIPTPIPEEGKWFGPDTKDPDGKTKWENNEDLDTNINISTTVTNLNSFCNSTSVNLYDLYYILQKCDNVTDIGAIFYGCSTLRDQITLKNPLNRNTFKHCEKVTTVSDSIPFSSTIIYSNSGDSKYDGTLAPLKNLKSVVNTFNGLVVTDSGLFPETESGKGMGITSITQSFGNIVFVNNSNTLDTSKIPDEVLGNTEETVTSIKSDLTFIDSDVFLKNLPDLKTIDRSINGWSSGTTENGINLVTKPIGETGKEFTDILYYNTKLTSISQSLNFRYKGVMIDPFGGHPDLMSELDKFPGLLIDIGGSLIDKSSSGELKLTEYMFNRLVFLSTLCYRTNLDFTKAFSGFRRTYDGQDFPYGIFSRNTKLTDISGFFEDAIMTIPKVIELPGNLFESTTELTYVDSLFKNIKCKYRLSGKGFINCKLESCKYLFYEDSSSNGSDDANLYKEGGVPYGLLYMTYEDTSSITGWTAEDSITDGINENFGITEEGEWIPDEELDKPLPQQRSYSITTNKIRRSIKDARYLISGLKRNTKYYSQDVGLLEEDNYGDILEKNENYNPVKYIINKLYDPRETIPNPNYDPSRPELGDENIPNPNRDIRRIVTNSKYDPYELVWNYWCLDGSSENMADIIKSSSLYTAVKGGRINAPTEIDENLFTAPSAPTNTNINQLVRGLYNYMVPSDLFRYCENSNGTLVDFALYKNGSNDGWNNYHYTKGGLRGRISRFLFTPLSKISSLKGIFYMTPQIAPYEDGLMYPSDLFSSNTSLKDVSSIFEYSWVQGSTGIPSTLFNKNFILSTIDLAWHLCFFPSSTIDGAEMVPGSLFKNNPSLLSAIGTFSRAAISGIDQNTHTAITDGVSVSSGVGIKDVDGVSLLNPSYNPNLKYVSAFLAGCSDYTGTVPEFWKFKNMDSKVDYNTFSKLSKAKVTNSDDIPAEWASKMTD